MRAGARAARERENIEDGIDAERKRLTSSMR
jgi:hypothetical protein